MKRVRLFISPALLAFLIFQPLSGANPRDLRHVLVLYAEDKDNPGQQMVEEGIRAGLRSSEPFDTELYTEYLDVSRFGDLSHAQVMADFLRRKYLGMELHAIVTVYPYAVDFLLANRRMLFPEVPVIAVAITRSYADIVERSPARSSVTGTIAGGDFAGFMDSALRLRPKTKRIAVVAGTAPNDILSERGFRTAFKPYSETFDLIDLTKLSIEETLSRVGSLSPDTIVYYSSILRDGAGKTFAARDALSLVARASRVPVFGVLEPYLGYGIVGCRLVSFRKHGTEAAALVFRIMGGEPPGSIPFGGNEAYVSAYDWRELKRWGISEKGLPPGSIVEFKSPSLWEEHKEKIVGGLFFITIETLLVIALFVNLRKKRRAEAENTASALRYRAIADYTYDWEYWSAPEGKLNYMSPSCERITGYTVREFMEDPSLFDKIVVPEDREIWAMHNRDAYQDLKARHIEFRIRTTTGEIRWIDHTCLPVNDSEGKFLGIRASNRDITDRKRVEIEAQQHRNELAHVGRVAALGELTSSLAHELNQPLAAIRNYANAAQRFLSSGEPNLTKAREALEGIIRDDRRAAEVISGVRSLLKKEEPRYVSVHMNEIIQETLAFIRTESALQSLSIETELAPDLFPVLGDRAQLQQVLLNLVLNARDAMGETKPDERKLLIKTEPDKEGGVKVSVKDCGEGIEDTFIEKLFEPFHTTKPGGMGMGLAISARIIYAHGGRIWAENNPDRGATFYFVVPSKETGKLREP